jgi:primary-amine oxidase
MHDHVLNFEVDFDILGTKNTITTTESVAVSEVYPWSAAPPSTPKTTASSTWPPTATSSSQFTVVNLDGKNAYGEQRGYHVLPSAGTINLTVPNSRNLVNAANWAKHDLFVTRHHDTEPRSSHPCQSQDVANPPINFDDFFNGESLLQEDIVA